MSINITGIIGVKNVNLSAAGGPPPPANYSNLFNGSNNFLSVADNAAFDVSTGNFTTEAWIYPTGDTTPVGRFFLGKANSGSFGPFALGFEGGVDQLIGLSSISGAGWEIQCLTTGNPNTSWNTLKNKWSHVAFVRNGSTFTLYLNGVNVSSTSSGASLVQNNELVTIGRTNYPDTNFPGYISNLRIVKGTAVYTGNSFSVPTSPLTNISGTSLLTCQSATIVDNSSNAFAITNNNGVTVNSLNPFN